MPTYIWHSRVTPRPRSIPRPTSDEIDIIDSYGSNWDIVIDYRDDVGAHQWYITWWGRTYLRVIFSIDFPRGNPRLWRYMGDKEDPDTSKDLGEEDRDDQDDDVGEKEIGGDGDDPDVGEGDHDGDDEEDGEEEDEDEEDEEAEEDESDVVPHNSEDDTIGLDPPSIPLRVEKYPIRGLDPSPHHLIPTMQRRYERGEPSGSQS